VTSLQRFPGFEETPTEPVLVHRRAGGGGGRWLQTCWVWPLPPPGSLGFVCEWPAAGIGLSLVEIEAQLIIDAAERAEFLWEDGAAPGAARVGSSRIG
jgi:hypothetical protein